MFKPLKSLFKYIQNLHTKPLNDDKLIHNTKEVTGATTIATNTLSSTSSLTSSVVMQSGEFCNMKNWNTNSATQNNGGEQLSYHLQTQHMDDGTYGADTPYTDYDEDDIETQIKSSIMLKKPLTNNLIKKETIETSSLSSSSSTSSLDIGININSSEKCNSYEIVSPHYNCNDIEDDELEDFRYDPTENFQNNSPKHQKTTTRVIKLPAKLNDMNRLTDVEEEKENEEDLEHKQFIYSNSNDTDTDMDEQVVEVEDEKNAEEPFINLQSITGSEIIVDTELSSSAKDNNHKDIILCNGDINIIISNSDDNEVDPLEIAQEDHEAFSVDRASVLKQLNLLNPLGLSQDDDDDAITVTTDGEMECWLDNDENDNDKRPPQIINDNIDDANDETNKPSSSTASCVDERGDGSDSGLGSETSALQMTVESMHEASQLSSSLNTSLTSTATTTTAAKRDCNANNASSARSISTRHAVYSDDGRVKGEDEKLSPSLPSILSTSSLTIPVPAKESTPTIPTAKRSNLKRRLKVDTDHSNNNLDSTNVSVANAVMKTQKKPKRSISFNSVHIYYFSRQQGFNCVPSAGGCTLGMAAVHESSRIMTLAEHTAELRRAHRLQLQEINPRGSSSDDSEESEEDFLSEGSGSDLDGESSGFLQPVSPKQRRAILKAAGIRKIDPAERAECRDIRNSREICGCSCRNYCDPETCSCSQWGIKCQVDRDMFPCGCTRESCGNPIGRVEFNSDRVHSHYIHTLLRLEVENRQGNPYHVHLAPNVLNSTTSTTSPSTAALASAAATASLTMPSCSFYQNHIPTQSNYSSGYGSPAYNIGSESIVQSALSNLSSDYYNHHTVQQQASTSSVHIYEPHLNTTHTPIINQFDVDDLDADLYSTTTATAVASTFSYAAAAARVNSAATGGIVTPYHNINYDQIPSRQISSATFNAYHNTNTMTNNSYLNTTDDVSIMVGVTSCPHRTYSSCAVPSDPPFGTATTTESSVIEFPATNQLVSVLETTTAPSCHVALTASDIANAMETEETNNFINVLQAVNESNVRHNKISNNNNNNINNNNNANNNNNDNQINDLLHVTVAVVRPTTTTATINGHITMATVSSVSASTTEIQQQKPPIPMEMDVETATPTTTTVNLKMNDLRHCDAQSQNIINNTAHNNLLDHTGDSVAGTSAPAVNAAASISTTVDGDVLNVITPTPAKAVANPITTSLKTIINNAMINS